MSEAPLVDEPVTPQAPGPAPVRRVKDPYRSLRRTYPYLVLAAFVIGLLTSYLVWGPLPGRRVQPVAALQPAVADNTGSDTSQQPHQQTGDMAALIEEVNPAAGYTLPVTYGDLGPQLIKAGVIDYDAFAAIYSDGGTPLSQDEVDTLQRGSNAQVTINARNAHFLLNFFWAVGLANKNTILTEGPMVTQSGGKIEGFASTGGWGLASKPVTDIYASMDLIPLTPEQQQRVEEVARGVYRPCCGNSTFFPDCNHGMAMLGLLELMASQGATTDQMFTAAKEVNAFWFPQQTIETAMYLKATMDIDYVDADARLVVGNRFSSGQGAQAVHQQLQSAGILPKAPGQGGGCSN